MRVRIFTALALILASLLILATREGHPRPDDRLAEHAETDSDGPPADSAPRHRASRSAQDDEIGENSQYGEPSPWDAEAARRRAAHRLVELSVAGGTQADYERLVEEWVATGEQMIPILLELLRDHPSAIGSRECARIDTVALAALSALAETDFVLTFLEDDVRGPWSEPLKEWYASNAAADRVAVTSLKHDHSMLDAARTDGDLSPEARSALWGRIADVRANKPRQWRVELRSRLSFLAAHGDDEARALLLRELETTAFETENGATLATPADLRGLRERWLPTLRTLDDSDLLALVRASSDVSAESGDRVRATLLVDELARRDTGNVDLEPTLIDLVRDSRPQVRETAVHFQLGEIVRRDWNDSLTRERIRALDPTPDEVLGYSFRLDHLAGLLVAARICIDNAGEPDAELWSDMLTSAIARSLRVVARIPQESSESEGERSVARTAAELRALGWPAANPRFLIARAAIEVVVLRMGADLGSTPVLSVVELVRRFGPQRELEGQIRRDHRLLIEPMVTMAMTNEELVVHIKEIAASSARSKELRRLLDRLGPERRELGSAELLAVLTDLISANSHARVRECAARAALRLASTTTDVGAVISACKIPVEGVALASALDTLAVMSRARTWISAEELVQTIVDTLTSERASLSSKLEIAESLSRWAHASDPSVARELVARLSTVEIPDSRLRLAVADATTRLRVAR